MKLKVDPDRLIWCLGIYWLTVHILDTQLEALCGHDMTGMTLLAVGLDYLTVRSKADCPGCIKELDARCKEVLNEA